MEHILVTGSTGFIGRALCQALVDAGHRVRGSFIEDSAPSGLDGRIEWVKSEPLGPDANWSTALAGITRVVHLAALAHTAAESATEDELMRVNAQGSERLCQAAVRAGSVQRFILMSSVAAVVPTDAGTIEEDAPPNPASPYGRSKLAAENAVRRVCNGSGCDYVFLRPTLVYGSGNPGNMLRLQRLVKLGLPLPLASINNRRSFCFIGNLVSAICSLMCHPDAANQAFTVCDNEKVSTPQLIRLIAECCGRNTWLVPLAPGIIGSLARICDHLEKRLCIHLPFDTETWCRLSGSLIGSNAKLHDRCGWSPPYPLQVGLRLTLGTSD